MEGNTSHPIRTPERKRVIPPHWFSPNYGPHGISASFSSEFAKLGRGKIIEYMLNGDEEKVKEATGGISIQELKDAREMTGRSYKNSGEKIG